MVSQVSPQFLELNCSCLEHNKTPGYLDLSGLQFYCFPCLNSTIDLVTSQTDWFSHVKAVHVKNRCLYMLSPGSTRYFTLSYFANVLKLETCANFFYQSYHVLCLFSCQCSLLSWDHGPRILYCHCLIWYLAHTQCSPTQMLKANRSKYTVQENKSMVKNSHNCLL